MAKQHAPRFLALVDSIRPHVRECTVHDLKAKMDQGLSPLVIDVREESEFAAGRIPGARHLSKGIIERDIEKTIPDVNAEIYLYCGGGFRSALTAHNLQQMGYSNVISVDGGWSGWTGAGFEVEKQ